MQKSIYLLPLLFLIACNDPNAKDQGSDEMPLAGGSPTTNATALVETASDATTLDKSYDLLQGTWQSDEDKKYILLFKDRTTADTYVGEADTTTCNFELSYTPCDSGVNVAAITKETGQKPVFLVKKGIDGDICYEAMALTKDQLTLMYLTRGNILSFHKMK